MTDKEIAQVYRDMELTLIESMQRNLGSHLAEEKLTKLDYPQWQAMKLKELRKYQQQNAKIINSKLSSLPDDVAEQLRAELKQGYNGEIAKFRDVLGNKRYNSAVANAQSFFKINTNKVDSLIKEVKESLYTANFAALRMSNDVYRDVIFKSAMFVSNGVATEKKAVDMAIKDFLERGLNCIEYKDGRRVNIADYASMAVRTANQRAYMMGEGEFRKEIGNSLIIISKHNTACELCKPWERTVLIDDVYSGGTQADGDYMLLSEAMKEGLFHPRCRHGLGTYYPEIEEIDREYNGEREKSVTDYGEFNEAHTENMIQKYKRLTLGSSDPENKQKYQEKLTEWEGEKQRNYVAISKNRGIIKEKLEVEHSIPHKIADGKNVVGEWRPREHFDSVIDDIIDYQGYNGKPRIVDDVDEFEQCVQEDHFIAERTVRADSEEDLRLYIDQLKCNNGEDYFYVNCGVGGAQYGQGMYCAADYSKGKIAKSAFQHEIENYAQDALSETTWFTLDPSSKILNVPYSEKASEYISDIYRETYMEKYATTEQVPYVQKLKQINRQIIDSPFDDDLYNARNECYSHLGDLPKKASNSTMYKTDKMKYAAPKDPGVLAAEMGYDAINAAGHGETGSYTVILNRTKLTIFGGKYEYIPK